MDERRQVRPRLTDEARTAWERVLIDNGVTWSSMFEALGQAIADGKWTPPPAAIVEARRLDFERKSRRRP